MASNALRHYKHFIIDCDGVVWKGSKAVEGSARAISTLHRHGADVLFLTNNASQTRKWFVNKFNRLGFKDVNEHNIVSAASAAAQLCRDRGIKKAFVVGQNGLIQELLGFGVDVIVDTKEGPYTEEEFEMFEMDKEVRGVVVGWDGNFNYRKLAMASLYLQNGATLIATNPDSCDKIGDWFMPGNGCLVEAIKRSIPASIADPEIVYAGKPSLSLMKRILSKHKFDKTRTLMIGDRLDTDIAFASQAGVDSALVLSGYATTKELESSETKPTYLAKNLEAVTLLELNRASL